jgi:hypothetical protein
MLTVGLQCCVLLAGRLASAAASWVACVASEPTSVHEGQVYAAKRGTTQTKSRWHVLSKVHLVLLLGNSAACGFCSRLGLVSCFLPRCTACVRLLWSYAQTLSKTLPADLLLA